MKKLFTLVCLVISLGARAQTAPDFTITDSNGQEHQLYADYLDQGKTVLLKIFFTTCPPCNAIAPLMEPFYQEWGAGEYDVEFFDLSNKSFDTDELVNAYKTTHNHTYPAAGVEGGSLTAVQPYESNMFGLFQGTPTFIVIAPDGTINFDVDGAGNQATIDSINTALLATGAQKPEQPVVVAGTLDFTGLVGSTNAVVRIIDDLNMVIDSLNVDENGQYSFSFLPSEIQPDWKVQVLNHGDPTQGVNVVDALQINKHILGIEPFTTVEEKLAADINGTKTINVGDVIALIKLLLGITTHFNDGQSWVIYPADLILDNSTNHPPVITEFTIPLQSIVSGSRSGNFKCVKKGNVN